MKKQKCGLSTAGQIAEGERRAREFVPKQEWLAGTNPTNALSELKITSATRTVNPAGLVVTWQSQNTRIYNLQRSMDLAQGAFSTIQDNIVGQAGTTSYADTNTVGPGPFFYRVGVKLP